MSTWRRQLACVALGLAAGGAASAAEPIHIEAEAGELHGVTVATEPPGYSGAGYVTGFDAEDDTVTLETQILDPGVYNVFVGFRTPGGHKGYGLRIGDQTLSAQFPATAEFARHHAGRVELPAGPLSISVLRGWGYFDIDYVELTPAPPVAPPKKPPATPCDPDATPAARDLLALLVEHYGTHTLSGQQNLDEFESVREAAGKAPAILSTDLMDYSPSRITFGADPKDAVERTLEMAERGHIVSLLWHWNAPADLINKAEHVNERGETVQAMWWSGFYTRATTFDVEKALADEGSEAYRLILRDIDAIAEQLRKAADAGVPVLWRPLHEADGRWFWWGAKGPEPFKQLWRLMFDRLTRHHGLHNLLWVWTGDDPDWYPGDAYVDVIGVDAYPDDPGDALTARWDALLAQYDGRKLIALTEFGGVPDVEKMHRLGVWFAYFVPWVGDLGPRKMDPQTLQRIYTSEAVITADELPPLD